ncbi:unnamed protein product [Brassica rapa]|uniref:Oligopeptide transporter n=2 Tax=Brassica TaxID=3705 RepID=A0A3P5ZHK1_BRACM|nr:unnamed protein product [Brassica napus]CAG7880142.1 unnamed protein product [Brassica rapa]CDY67678.1 BnaCnng55940D [Brassica napus]VDC79572.1 unnamed protein product [Brassica rapa]
MRDMTEIRSELESESDSYANDEISIVPQVELTVPKTDDPDAPTVTFRMWVLGIAACVLLSFVNQFFWYRTNPLTISSVSAQIAVVPIGHLMAKVLPTRRFFQGTRWSFTMNPGPFSTKEHVLITVFPKSCSGAVYASHILSAVKLFYKRRLDFLPALLIMITTQAPGLNIITEYIIGYAYPDRPVANICFKTYGYISMSQSLTFRADLKLGAYIKIESRIFFKFDTSMGARAPLAMALPSPHVYGRVAPALVYLATRIFPKKKWISNIHMPVLIGATAIMPPATAVNFTSWLVMVFVSGHFVFKYKREWWQRYNYVLSGGMDAGTGFMSVLLFLALQRSDDIMLGWWENSGEGFRAAKCPTARGVIVHGCPVF